ncbi:MAG: hypothetical protein KGQ51_08290 [Planctomycetes bacterium]|nr:hypothetical protein [Planctomycetota bacterium]
MSSATAEDVVTWLRIEWCALLTHYRSKSCLEPLKRYAYGPAMEQGLAFAINFLGKARISGRM